MRAPLLVLAMTVLSAGVVHAADPVRPRIGPEPGAKTKLERVLASLGEGEARPVRERVRSGEVLVRDALHRLLLEGNASYRDLVAAFERDGGSPEELEKLAAGAPASPLGLALRAHATFYSGRAFLARDEFARACGAFEKVLGELRDGTPWTDEARLLLGYSYARRPEVDEGLERLHLERARAQLAELDGAPARDTPERTREAARWLLLELSGEGSGPLLELARRMDAIEGQLGRERTGRPTQRRQEQVIAEIDRLIELMREKENEGKGGGNGSNQRGPRATGPARRSTLPGALQPKDIAQTKPGAGQEWGNLPEKDRKEVLNVLDAQKFPPRYREIIEQYLLEIAKSQPTKKPAEAKKP